MSEKHDELIKNYKSLEAILREKNMSVKDFEDTILEQKDSSLRQKMTLIRMIRNYIQHEKDYEKFIAISPEMNKILKDIIENLQREYYGIVKDDMITLTKNGIVDITDKVITAAEIMAKKNRPIIVFNNDEFVGFLDKAAISDAFALSNITKNTTISKCMSYIDMKDLPKIASDCPLHMVNQEKYLVINKSGKIIGILEKSI